MLRLQGLIKGLMQNRPRTEHTLNQETRTPLHKKRQNPSKPAKAARGLALFSSSCPCLRPLKSSSQRSPDISDTGDSSQGKSPTLNQHKEKVQAELPAIRCKMERDKGTGVFAI